MRSRLKAVQRTDKQGRTYWCARGTVPVAQRDGSIAGERLQRRLEGATAAERKAEVDRLNAQYEAAAASSRQPMTFSRALTNYLELGHPAPLYGFRLVEILGPRQAASIDDTIMLKAASEIWPDGAAPATINRHLYTPVVAILRLALKGQAPELARPKGHNEVKPLSIPPPEWFRAVIPRLMPHVRAIMLLLTVHGRRVGDALKRTPADFDPVAGTLTIGRTKTGTALLIDLHPEVAKAINEMPGWRDRAWLFGVGPKSHFAVYRDLRRACAEADQPYYTTHPAGRHSFATRLLRAGHSTVFTKDAGGWKSIDIVSRRYGHLEQRELTAGVHRVADAAFRDMTVEDAETDSHPIPANGRLDLQNRAVNDVNNPVQGRPADGGDT